MRASLLPMNLLVNGGWRRQKAAPLPIGWGEGKARGAWDLDTRESSALCKNIPSPHPMGRGALCTRFMLPMRATERRIGVPPVQHLRTPRA